MSSEKPASAPPGCASSLTDTTDTHPPPGSSAKQPPQQQITTTGERMVSAAGSMVLPAGVINPAVPIRNIQMKFAVLVGLIEVGEVSNRDIVETVLNLDVLCFHGDGSRVMSKEACEIIRTNLQNVSEEVLLASAKGATSPPAN